MRILPEFKIPDFKFKKIEMKDVENIEELKGNTQKEKNKTYRISNKHNQQ